MKPPIYSIESKGFVMANYILAYDLYGRSPTHQEVHRHVVNAGFQEFVKLMDTTWYIGTPHSLAEVHTYFMEIMSDNDRVVLIEVKEAKLENLMATSEEILEAFGRNR